MIQVDLTHMRRFIALPYEAALAPRLRIAHNHLQKGDGAGGDFTGWVRLPQEYDRQEFDRIQAAARESLWMQGASSSACAPPTITSGARTPPTSILWATACPTGSCGRPWSCWRGWTSP